MASKKRPSLPKNYKPTEKENFMSARQREYFRRKLLSWREELVDGSSETLKNMQEESLAEPDMADRASLESDRALELRTRDRQRKLISKIDEALERLEAGEYGYCEETGDPISLGASRSTANRDAERRSARTPRAYGADPPRRLMRFALGVLKK